MRGLPNDTTRRTAVTAMAAVAHRNGLEVTASGVETAAQAAALAELGCKLASGPVVGMPVEAADVAGLFDDA